MVLTQKWMFNVEAEFDKKTKCPTFKSENWQHPISAIHTIELTKNENRLVLVILFDHEYQNMLLVSEGHKKIKKFERKLEFTDEITAREFLY